MVDIKIFSFVISFASCAFKLVVISSRIGGAVPVNLTKVGRSASLRHKRLLTNTTVVVIPVIVLFSFIAGCFVGKLATKTIGNWAERTTLPSIFLRL